MNRQTRKAGTDCRKSMNEDFPSRCHHHQWAISWSLRLSGISSRHDFLHRSTVQVLLWLTCLWTFFQALSIVHTTADHLSAYFLLAMLTHRVSDQSQIFGFWMQTSKPKPFFLKQTGRLPVFTNSHLTLQLRRPSLMWVGRSVVWQVPAIGRLDQS